MQIRCAQFSLLYETADWQVDRVQQPPYRPKTSTHQSAIYQPVLGNEIEEKKKNQIENIVVQQQKAKMHWNRMVEKFPKEVEKMQNQIEARETSITREKLV